MSQGNYRSARPLIEGKYNAETVLRAATKLENRRTAGTRILSLKKEAAFPKFREDGKFMYGHCKLP